MERCACHHNRGARFIFCPMTGEIGGVDIPPILRALRSTLAFGFNTQSRRIKLDHWPREHLHRAPAQLFSPCAED